MQSMVALSLDTDGDFDAIYTAPVRALSAAMWTPVDVARQAARWLVTKPGVRVLDLGSGVGKFCFIGALSTNGHFTGIERHQPWVQLSQRLMFRYHIPHVEFIAGDLQEIDFSGYSAFYLFNAFGENASDSDEGFASADACAPYIRRQLAAMPSGTRVVTFCGGPINEWLGYQLENSAFNGWLNLWVKRGNKIRHCDETRLSRHHRINDVQDWND